MPALFKAILIVSLFSDSLVAQEKTKLNIPTQGLVSYWSFDEGSGDVVKDTVSQHHGKIKDARRAKGVVGDALYFNGKSSWVTLDNPEKLNFSGQITIAAWIHARSNTDTLNIVAHGPVDKSKSGDPSKSMVFLRIRDGKYQFGSWDGSDHFASAAIPKEDARTAIHLVGVYDGKTWRLYRNGLKIALHHDKIGAVKVDAPWAIGSHPSGKKDFFFGAIDEVCIYNRGLTAREVASLTRPSKK